MWKLYTNLSHEPSRETNGENSSRETMGTFGRE